MNSPSKLFERVSKGDDMLEAKYRVFKDFYDEFYENRKDGQDLVTLCFKLVHEEGFKGCLHPNRECKKDCWVCPKESK
jgi:hypothetical protein